MSINSIINSGKQDFIQNFKWVTNVLGQKKKEKKKKEL